jgi:putative addiction module component (TIGR02574 family)
MSSSEIAMMSIAERLYLMEQLWDSFKPHEEQLSSPQWHQNILEERQKRYQKGELKTISFDELKASMNARI